ncbi:hypothetical protein H112_03219 [Trichophyton rubrum D6]|nr:uncharacterized protein TERG_05830 [Trichophyton rubrum CBS 118892]EZF24366.1 hypothetical protein H100_03223 [Trichophyton rubrum MR850]EZF43327.1 hypothetical protein H102_03217 [Trichophyton rubrum CBS 100081]EZF53969.1 hypothetical protein H103_03231 [Trichophyton rubrum CBS 288.86]EZF64552.1 hypothetical protein H104_03213 [Trichophyton rubrum CBS 289.86]EZF85896.1 hypothetical protein H110_03224 [Trichophyton rubrum MR1448]EZF96677.1 hypothetical protein H113_03232 [Trichophyton rubr
MERDEAREYLESLVDKVLRVHTSDSRVFVGLFKCTDNDRNMILSTTHEYRCPTESAPAEQASAEETEGPKTPCNEPLDFNTDMTRRFIGLVVIPGQHITKIELDKSTTGAHGG